MRPRSMCSARKSGDIDGQVGASRRQTDEDRSARQPLRWRASISSTNASSSWPSILTTSHTLKRR